MSLLLTEHHLLHPRLHCLDSPLGYRDWLDPWENYRFPLGAWPHFAPTMYPLRASSSLRYRNGPRFLL